MPKIVIFANDVFVLYFRGVIKEIGARRWPSWNGVPEIISVNIMLNCFFTLGNIFCFIIHTIIAVRFRGPYRCSDLGSFYETISNKS